MAKNDRPQNSIAPIEEDERVSLTSPIAIPQVAHLEERTGTRSPSQAEHERPGLTQHWQNAFCVFDQMEQRHGGVVKENVADEVEALRATLDARLRQVLLRQLRDHAIDRQR